MRKITKKAKVLMHLEEFGSISTWEAIKEYGATRLSAIIFNLKKEGYTFDGENVGFVDRYGASSRFKKYILTGRE